jgi:hypothetical protein
MIPYSAAFVVVVVVVVVDVDESLNASYRHVNLKCDTHSIIPFITIVM